MFRHRRNDGDVDLSVASVPQRVKSEIIQEDMAYESHVSLLYS